MAGDQRGPLGPTGGCRPANLPLQAHSLQAHAVSAQDWIGPAMPSLLGRVWVWFFSRTQRARHSFHAEFPFESCSGLSGFCPGRVLLALGISQSKQRAEIRWRTDLRQKANTTVVAAGLRRSPSVPSLPRPPLAPVPCLVAHGSLWPQTNIAYMSSMLSPPHMAAPSLPGPQGPACLLLPPARTSPRPVGARPAPWAPQNPRGSRQRGRGQPLPSSPRSAAPFLPSPASVGKSEREPREPSCVSRACRRASRISCGAQGSSGPMPCPQFSPCLPQTAGTGLSAMAGPPPSHRWRPAGGRLARRRPLD